MADGFRDSSFAIQTPRVFPPGCGPDAPITPSALRWLLPRTQTSNHQTQSLTLTLTLTTKQPPIIPNPGDGAVREKLLAVLKLFRRTCKERQTEDVHRIDLKVLQDLKSVEGAFLEKGKENALRVGPVPGVEVGDRFKYRAELMIAGLHRRLQNGIDWRELNGNKVATCVVANEKSYDKLDDPDVLKYRGEGGGGSLKGERKVDQVMKGGNLGLKNSAGGSGGLRVVRGLKVEYKGRGNKTVYVYDGLYDVVEWETIREAEGNLVIDFVMKRRPGQKRINWKDQLYYDSATEP